MLEEPVEPTNQTLEIDESFEQTEALIAIIKAIACQICGEPFLSKTKLHNHLKVSPCLKSQYSTKTERGSEPPASTIAIGNVIRSDAKQPTRNGYGFRGWHYVTVQASLKTDGQLHAICLDTGCTMSLIDRSFLNNELPDAKVQRMTSLIAVRGLGSTSHNTAKFVLLICTFLALTVKPFTCNESSI